MKQDKVNIKVGVDNRRQKDKKRFPLKLRITHKGERKYYSTGYDSTIEEWEIINTANAKGNLRKIKNAITTIENDVEKCISQIVPFSFREFEKLFFNEKNEQNDLKTMFINYIETLKNNEQFGTALSYDTAYKSLIRFFPDFDFKDVTVEFLQKFERSLLAKGRSITTVGFYLRALRTILNLAKENGTIKPEDYPFGKRKYVLPTGKNIKKALSIDQIKQVFNFETTPGTSMDKAKDFWIFSYLCNGINIMDIAHLQWENIQRNTINFDREKTKRTNRGNPQKIIALRNDHINNIIEKWSNNKSNRSSKDLIFNIIEKHDDGEVVRRKVQQFVQTTNKWMKQVGMELGFEFKLTTYVARHSFATILVRSGAPLAFASQSLGHTNVLTTQKYFAGFDLDAHAEYTKALTSF